MGELHPENDMLPPRYKYRYAVAIQKQIGYYQDVFETNTFKDAENKCVDLACDGETICIVFDRESLEKPITFRHDATVKDKENVVVTTPTDGRKKR